MNTTNSISRRSLLRAAAPAAAAAIVPALALPVLATEQLPTLSELFAWFGREARRIDPTIIEVWSMTDERMGDLPSDKRLCAVHLVREGLPFVRKGKAPASAVHKAIRAHRRAWQEFNACCDAADHMSENYGGKSAEANWRRLSRIEDEKFTALLRMPATGNDAGRRAAYLLRILRTDGLEPKHVGALLRSMVGVH
jgi:hypothetical protein